MKNDPNNLSMVFEKVAKSKKLRPFDGIKSNTLSQIFEISKNLEFAILSPLSDNKDYPNYKVQKELTNKKKTLLGVGPMSANVVDSTIELSDKYKVPLILIASRRQIDFEYLEAVLDAKPRCGESFTYSHFHPLYWAHKLAPNKTTINFSADNLAEAVAICANKIAPVVTVVKKSFWKNGKQVDPYKQKLPPRKI